MSNEVSEYKKYYASLAETLDNAFSPNELAIIQQNVAKGTTNTELAYFLNVCKTMELNPFNKEVWCYKDNRSNLLIFAGRDGFLSKAQKNPKFNGVRSIEICENDEYSFDVINNKIHHVITKPKAQRGAILYGVAIVFRKDGEPTIELADFAIYNKGYNTWKTHPAEMIKKVAESHALKKAFGISGIQSEYDFDVKDGIATPINGPKGTDSKLTRIKELYDQHKDALNVQDVEHIERIINNKETSHYDSVLKELENI